MRFFLERLLAVLLVCPIIIAQSSPLQSQRTVQVLYVVQGTTVDTYNVDPASGGVKLAGELTIGSGAGIEQIAASPDGKFVYVICCIAEDNDRLSIFTTDSHGVPQKPALQVIRGNFVHFVVSPNGRFAYGLLSDRNPQNNSIYKIRLFDRDPETGRLTSSETEFRYNAGTCCAWLDLFGFNSQGGKLYDGEGSDLSDGGGDVYYYHRVDPNTGKLSKPVFLINGSYAGRGYYADVSLADNVIARSQTDDYSPDDSWIDIYPNVSDPQTSLIHCTNAMLDICAYTYRLWLHPSGQYLFVKTNVYPITVVKLDLGRQQLIPTATVPDFMNLVFSPDGNLVYLTGRTSGFGSIQVYKFNSSAGTLQAGAQISTVLNPALYPAERR